MNHVYSILRLLDFQESLEHGKKDYRPYYRNTT
jgi:hypothetical protein